MSNRIPGQNELLRQALALALTEAGRGGLGRAEIAHLATTAGTEDYVPLLADLERGGDVVEWNKRWYALATTDWCAGELQALAGGDALLRSGAGGEVGYFVPQRYLNGGRPGDQVIAKPVRGKKKRTGQRLPEAGVVKVVGRGFDRLVGTLEARGAKHYLVPFDRRIRLEVEVVDGDAVPPAHFVSVAVDHKGSSRLGPLLGRVERVLGAAEDPGVDVEVVVEHFGLPTEFPPTAQEKASGLPEDPTPRDFEGRRDLRSELVVTIDGATAKDFDDAIGVRKREDGSFDFAVHIADVAHYVALGGVLDLEAYRRGTSVYLGDRVLPMLPEALSNGLCSLRPDVPRLVQSVFLRIGPDGRVQSREFSDSVIQSRRRLTYTEVSELLAGTADEGAESAYGEVLPMLRHAAELTDLLMQARARRGSIDFDLPVGDLLLDDEGTAIGVQPSQRTISHRMVEELMLAANEAVAAELFSAGQPAMFRTHDAPRPQRLSELREILLGLDYELPDSLEGLHPSVLQRVMSTFAGRPEEPFVSALVLRSMQRARYANEDLGHYALSERHYAHFTSPIRRYPDLVAHRKLRALRAPAAQPPVDEATRLGAVAEHCSEMERRGERAERELRRWRLVRLLSDRVGETFWGRVTGVEPFGLFIELEDFFVDGLVTVRDLDDDFYVYDPANHRLDGRRTQRSFRLADRVEVRVTAVDTVRRMIDLVPADMAPPPAERAAGASSASDGHRRRRGGRRRRP